MLLATLFNAHHVHQPRPRTWLATWTFTCPHMDVGVNSLCPYKLLRWPVLMKTGHVTCSRGVVSLYAQSSFETKTKRAFLVKDSSGRQSGPAVHDR